MRLTQKLDKLAISEWTLSISTGNTMIPIKNLKISAVVFDFDGTLTTPGALDFSAIREVLNCPPDRPVLEYIEALPDPWRQAEAFAMLDEFEIEAAQNTRPQAGAETLVQFLAQAHISQSIITRNSLKALKQSFGRFKRISMDDFDFIITRDDSFKRKPSGDAIRHIAANLKMRSQEILVVGDYRFDIEAGKDAQAITVLLNQPRKAKEWGIEPDFIIQSLEALYLGLCPEPYRESGNKLLDVN